MSIYVHKILKPLNKINVFLDTPIYKYVTYKVKTHHFVKYCTKC
jgi:hypothetical protein